MLLETGMSDLPNISPETAENMSDQSIQLNTRTYRADLETVAVVCAMNLYHGNDTHARAGAAEVVRLNATLRHLYDESSIRRTNEKSIAALIAELAKGNPA